MDNDKINEEKYDKYVEDTICPNCGCHRFYSKYYCGKTVNICVDCGYFEKFENVDENKCNPLVDKD